MKKLTMLGVTIFLLGLGRLGHAVQVIVTVDADLNSSGCSASSPDVPFISSLKDTGLDINEGDLVSITATGTWWNGGGSDPYTDANGHTGVPCHTQVGPIQALLGQINDVPLRACDPGAFEKTFFVGTNYSQTAQASGRLFLAFCDTDFGNNEGSVNATVTVTPAPQPPVSMILRDVTIDRKTGKFEIKGSIDVTDPAFDHLVNDPSLRLRLELETQGSPHDPYGIVGEDEVPLDTKKKTLQFK